MHTWLSHRASLSPKRSTHDQRDLGVSAALRMGLDVCIPRSPIGRPYPPSGPWLEGPGCTCRFVEGAGSCAYLAIPRRVPIP